MFHFNKPQIHTLNSHLSRTDKTHKNVSSRKCNKNPKNHTDMGKKLPKNNLIFHYNNHYFEGDFYDFIKVDLYKT